MSRHVLILIAVLLPGAAMAETSRETARKLLRQGRELLDRGDCKAALERFTRAKEVFPTSYKVDVNIGTALQCLGRSAEALTHFELFLDRADAETDRDMIGRVRAELDPLRRKVATVKVYCVDPQAVVAVDGVEVGRTPLPHALYLQPGSHRLTVTRGAQSFATVVEAVAGARRDVVATWSAAPVAATPGKRLGNAFVDEPPRLGNSFVEEPGQEHPRPARSTPVYKRW